MSDRQEPPRGEPDTSVSTQWAKGYRLIPTVRLPDAIKRTIPPPRYWCAYLLVVSEWPLIINLLLYAAWRKLSTPLGHIGPGNY